MLLRHCGVILFSNNDITFDFDRLNAIQVFLSYAFSNKRFYLMMLGFGGNRSSHWKYNMVNNVLVLVEQATAAALRINLWFNSNNSIISSFLGGGGVLAIFLFYFDTHIDFAGIRLQPCILIRCFSWSWRTYWNLLWFA